MLLFRVRFKPRHGNRRRSRSAPNIRNVWAAPTPLMASYAGRGIVSKHEWHKSGRRGIKHIRVKIYQVNLKRDQGNAAFMSRDSLQRLLGKTEIDFILFSGRA